MEGKKLNLNQPFLSVRTRRNSSQAVATSLTDDERSGHTFPIPCYKSELKSGPVGEKGAVPFQWEQTPGKPREDKAQSAPDDLIAQSETKLPPPGRYGKPIVGDCSQSCLNNFCNYEDCELVKEKSEEKMSPKTEGDGNNIYDSGDEDEVYEDALDRLSQTNSTFLNCSLSGVSGLDDSDAEPCRVFSRDSNTLNLVMARFLPAAKAMVAETSQFVVPKKAIANREEPRQVKKTAVKKEDKPLLRYGPSFANRHLNYYHAGEEAGEEDEEESSDDDDDGGHGALMPSVCGLLPRFCFKGSSGILNPIPGLSFKVRASKSRGNEVRCRSSSNCPNAAVVRSDFKHHSGTVDATATTVCENGERVKTFGEFLDDDNEAPGQELDSGGRDVAEEDAIRIGTIQTIESQPVLVLGPIDEDHAVDIPSEFKNVHLVGCNKNSSTAADDEEIGPRESEICDRKLSEYINISPPLPKSPSDSWLGRTLPSVSSKNARHRHSKTVAGKLNPKVPVSVSRWEAIVKSSKLQHHYSHYPEQELLTPLQKT